MRCPVYRSLDRPSAFFGIRGRFITLMGGLLVVSVLAAFFIGAMTVSAIGFVTFGIGAVGSYIYVMSLQGNSSDRAFSMRMNARRYARYVRTPAGAFRRIWRKDWRDLFHG